MASTKQTNRNADVPMIPEEREFRYRLIQAVFRVVFHTICKVRVEGLEKLPRKGPLIMYSNHLHLFDAPIIFSILPVRGTVMAAEKWETNFFLGPLLRAINAVFINRGAADRKAIRTVQTLLERGAIVAIAPEGTRSRTGGLQEGKGGAALLASKTGAILAPLVVYGHETWFEDLRHFRRASVVVRFGDAFRVPPLEGGNKSQQVADLTQDMMVRLARLLPPAYRGVYRSLVPEDDGDGEG